MIYSCYFQLTIALNISISNTKHKICIINWRKWFTVIFQCKPTFSDFFTKFYMLIETLFELFRVKGSFKEHICSGIVYRFTCFNCNVHYYGRASCYFYNRAAERNSHQSCRNWRFKNIDQSLISDHLKQRSSMTILDDFGILAADSNKSNFFLSLLLIHD